MSYIMNKHYLVMKLFHLDYDAVNTAYLKVISVHHTLVQPFTLAEIGQLNGRFDSSIKPYERIKEVIRSNKPFDSYALSIENPNSRDGDWQVFSHTEYIRSLQADAYILLFGGKERDIPKFKEEAKKRSIEFYLGFPVGLLDFLEKKLGQQENPISGD